ncbi:MULTISPECIES: S8 family serine peptidase [Actinosynnema]|uniref:S8 family serine peptidase n=1 Tax=Actinosynnema TaxID=40566 RepID=UPI0020A48D73|nr:S8 family serine peptidase [Actinosynnema pretiosum]
MRPLHRLAVAAITVAATAAPVPAALAAPSGATPPTADETRRVTLITGDVVTATRHGSAWSLATALVPDRGHLRFHEYERGGDRYVLPDDAAARVASGQVDVELFNVTGLIRQGYDDAGFDATPLLVRGPAAESSIADAGQVLSSIGARVAEVPKSGTGSYWAELSAPRVADAGGTEVWLNGRARVSLDRTVPQIGAPAAHDAGLTGEGVRVAVLDTGYDPAHPDLAGRVSRARDFTAKGSPSDGHGHGTHVASTVGGSGAASGGKYRGVAPEADLLVGKVLDDGGWGNDAEIIAGMEWAAREADADVINMSLGSGPTDGADPMALAVDALTAETGALFVIAAGNSGRDESVGSPATADSALAVGSVEKDDSLSGFSSRGPRTGRYAVKPEITAPGGSVVAAEAGTGGYRSMSGTSMAAPHVAGAAAILAQRHPDWTAELLKPALVSTSAGVQANALAVGGGRLDVARAVTSPVHASTSTADFDFRWEDTTERRVPVGYRNDGDRPVTLALSLDLAGTALSATSLVVPAGGTATVEVVGTPRAVAAGAHGGVLTASADGVALRTPVLLRQEAERYDVTAQLLDRDGLPAQLHLERYPMMSVVDLASGVVSPLEIGGATRLPVGRYAVLAGVRTWRDGVTESTVLAVPELVVSGHTGVSLDARDGERVEVGVDDPRARGGDWNDAVLAWTDGGEAVWYRGGGDARHDRVYAHSYGQGNSIGYLAGIGLTDQALGLAVDGREVRADWHTPADWRGTRDYPVAFGGGGRPEELTGVAGKLVVLDLPDSALSPEEIAARVEAVRDAGGAAVAMSARTFGDVSGFALPTVRVFGSWAEWLLAGARDGSLASAELTSRDASDVLFQLSHSQRGELGGSSEQHSVDDLAEVSLAYGAGVAGQGVSYARAFDEWLMIASTTWDVRESSARTHYATPGSWRFGIDWDSFQEVEVEVAAGGQRSLSWPTP